MRAALVLAIVCLSGFMGCTNTPWSSLMRAEHSNENAAGVSGNSQAAGSTGAADQATANGATLPGGAASGGAMPNLAAPNAAIAPAPGTNDISYSLDQLEGAGRINRQERLEFEASLAEIDNPLLKQHILTMVAAAGGKPATGPMQPPASQPALSQPTPSHPTAPPGFSPRMQDPATGFGYPSATISDGGPYANQPPQRIADRALGYPPQREPAPFPYNDELIERLQANTSQSLASRDESDRRYPPRDQRNPRYDEPYDPREGRSVHTNYLTDRIDRDRPRVRDRQAGYGDLADRDITDRDTNDTANWQDALDETIWRLERQTTEVPRSDEQIKKHAFLRMLYLMSGRKEDALRPIQGIPAVSQDFWIEEMYGLAEFLDHEEFPTASRRAAAALNRFAKAQKRLGELANVRVKRAEFCREVKSYGVITRFSENVFQPGETVLLYAEIENFRSTPEPEGFRTELRGSYVIQDDAQHRVTEEVLDPIVDICENERRDFFLNYFVTLPERIYPGRYHLLLTIEDTQSGWHDTITVDFEVPNGVR